MSELKILDSKCVKICKSPNYNFIFDKNNGNFARWGKTKDDDPLKAPGPEIADIEISTICHGVKAIGPCKFCYKGNTGKGENMSLETFKKLFSVFPPTLTQIAFGIGDIQGNPDMFPIFEYTREKGIIPNVTINGEGLTDDIAKKLVEVCGAVAVSHYDRDTCLNAVKKLTDLGLNQVNIHFMLSEETYDAARNLMVDKKHDLRLEKLRAIVFLGLKNKGRANCQSFTTLPQEKFEKIVNFALTQNIGIGFDSCSANKFLKVIANFPEYKKYEEMVEPCESGLFSSYFNVKGEFFPCSFMEGEDDWVEGIDVLKEGFNFQTDLWESIKVNEWKQKLLNCNRNCPHYKI